MPKKKNLSIRVNGTAIPVENRVVEYRLVYIVSLDGLIEAEKDYEDENISLEDFVLHAVMLDKLNNALQSLSDAEYKLIYALFFENDGQGMSEREYSSISGIPRKTLEYRRRKIFCKLKQILQG